MKSSMLFLSPLIALAFAAVPLGQFRFSDARSCASPDHLPEKRQTDLLAAKPQVKKIFKKVDAPTRYAKDGAKRVTLWYGPYRVRAMNVSSFLSARPTLRYKCYGKLEFGC
jgi:hypothetical protein